jgi:polysaccharide biosynthesis transport protein
MKRRYWILITTFVIIVLSAIIYTFQQTPIYQATTTLLIEPETPNVTDFRDFSGSIPYNEFYKTQIEIIRSRSVVKMTLDILKEPNDTTSNDDVEKIAAFQNRISIDPQKDTRLMNLSVKNADPAKASKEVNTLARVYIQHNLEDRRDASKDAFEWLSEKLVILEAKVKKSELDLLKYKEEEDIVNLEKRQSLLEERISETNESYITAGAHTIELKTMLNEITSLQQLQKAEALPRILDNELVQQLKQEQNTLELQLVKVSKKYKPQHPTVVGLQSQINNLKERIALEIEKIIKSIETEERISEANENMIRQNLDDLKRESMNLSQLAIQYGVLKREAESNKNMYDVLLLRLKETDISGSTNVNNIRIVDKAAVPVSPIKPDKMRNLIISVLLGLGFGISLCLLYEYLDNTMTSEEDIKLHLNETILGIVPKKKDINDFQIHEFDGINHSYREIKTTINFYSKEHILKTLLVTSSTEQEGKTTSVFWLGKTFSQSGFKVLLIDADIFKPNLHKLFNLSQGSGLSDYLLLNKDVKDLIIKTGFPDLYMIPAGLIPPNPAEVLGSQKLRELFFSLKDQFDIIIIDSPPVLVAIEVATIGTYIDGIAMVVKANDQSWQTVTKSLQRLKSLKGNVLGVILTSVKHSENSANYYYQKDYSKQNGRIGLIGLIKQILVKATG